METNAPLPHPNRASEHLAAERTFLAWVRTAIAVISLGFVVAKFSLWLRELAGRVDASVQIQGSGMSLPIGLGMIAAGAIMILLAAWRFHTLNLSIERGVVQPNRLLVAFVTVLVVAIAIAMSVYMLGTSLPAPAAR